MAHYGSTPSAPYAYSAMYPGAAGTPYAAYPSSGTVSFLMLSIASARHLPLNGSLLFSWVARGHFKPLSVLSYSYIIRSHVLSKSACLLIPYSAPTRWSLQGGDGSEMMQSSAMASMVPQGASGAQVGVPPSLGLDGYSADGMAAAAAAAAGGAMGLAGAASTPGIVGPLRSKRVMAPPLLS